MSDENKKVKPVDIIKISSGSQLLDIAIVIIFCFIVFTSYSFNLYDSRSECIDRWQGSNQTVKYTKQSGCMIKINNAWIKEKNIMVALPDKIIKD